MPVFERTMPFTPAQRCLRWIGGSVLVIGAVAIAFWSALQCAKIQFGYVAAYSYAGMFFWAIALCIIGLLLLIYWRTRSTGIALILCGIILYGGFVASIKVLKKFDRVAWMHEPPPVRFGPDQNASIVIYYRHGTSQEQINDFIENVLEEPAESRHAGKDYPEFIDEYIVLLPSQANGFDGSTLGVRPKAPPSSKAAYIETIRTDPRVEHVFVDVAPNAIQYPEHDERSNHRKVSAL
jgi:hypothetical protein